MLPKDLDFKLQIIEEHKKGASVKSLASKYDIGIWTIRDWIHQYNMFAEQGISKSVVHTKYDPEFKLHVINHKKEYNLSYPETIKLFSIKNSSTVALWEKQFKEKGIQGLSNQIGRPKNSANSYKQLFLQLEEKNADLEQQIDELKQQLNIKDTK
ncbi:transposase IS1296EH (ORFA), putative [Mycoplasma capricolum subsp. capricolum ATCC 27343]|uniref:Transposase IS1296EH (ORFA), putative n=1 Tax=Mycoplasma capricolum subsp. capricolum (strain California kid / ATCC 27343 / NCTC 10154) TaxID=340047 RepID=Q2SR23_MYCCT|nr:helix-turn-helix domain-containing protein [Mycoplasma capricolum]ABC01620.1 transposase IS1296EH (ORFA), putative [Mycoplasma capricolum subsp. capricolum ATCC 27343]